MTNPQDDSDEVDEYPSLEEELALDEAHEAELLNDEDDNEEPFDPFEVFYVDPEED